MIFILFVKILPLRSLLNKISTFLVEKQISHKMFVTAFEKMCFFYLDPDPYRIEKQSGSGSVMGKKPEVVFNGAIRTQKNLNWS